MPAPAVAQSARVEECQAIYERLQIIAKKRHEGVTLDQWIDYLLANNPTDRLFAVDHALVRAVYALPESEMERTAWGDSKAHLLFFETHLQCVNADHGTDWLIWLTNQVGIDTFSIWRYGRQNFEDAS